jgi:hypothetical protein
MLFFADQYAIDTPLVGGHVIVRTDSVRTVPDRDVVPASAARLPLSFRVPFPAHWHSAVTAPGRVVAEGHNNKDLGP